jgi:hypothetical protein
MDTSIKSFRFKSQFIYDGKISRMYYRIIAIAPLYKTKNLKDSTILEPLFWVSYNKLRPYLSTIPIYNPRNSTEVVYWNKLLDHRYLDGHIIKTSYENFNNKTLSQIYNKDPKNDPRKRLEAAEKILRRIDDYEQDRWVY